MFCAFLWENSVYLQEKVIMEEQKKNWINENGNLCFLWEGDDSKSIMTCAFVILALLIASFTISSFWHESFMFIGLIGSAIVFCIDYYQITNNEKKEDKVLLEHVKTKLDAQINAYISKQDDNIQEKKRCVFYHAQGTYGRIKGTYILVLFSDGSVIEYELMPHTLNEHRYYELQSVPNACKEEEALKAIIPYYSIKKFASKLTLSVNTQLNLFIIGSILISSILAVLVFWTFIHFNIKYIFLCVIGYSCFHFTYYKLFGNCIKVKTLTWIVDMPIIFLGIITKLAQPAMVIWGGLILPIFMTAGVSLIIIHIIKFLTNITISYHTLLFFLLTISEIICVHAPKVTKRIIRNSPLRNWGNHKYETYNEELALYIRSPKNYNFIFSVLYVIFLCLTSFKQIEYHSYLFSADIDNAILKSFLVFLAFSTMKQKSEDVEINTKDLLIKINGLFSHNEE